MTKMNRTANRLTAGLAIGLVVGLLAAEPAEARRGGSFGSRGSRTYSAPPPTRTAPQETAPVQRSMTPPQKGAATTPAQSPAPANAAAPNQARRGGFLGGMGGGLLAGLVAGGLIGALLGNGFGGLGAGLMSTLIQVAIIGLGVALLMMLFRRRKPAHAAAGFSQYERSAGPDPVMPSRQPAGFPGGSYAPQPASSVEIGIIQSDRDAFQRLLTEVQEAFAREDYGRLRELTTPEVMSYLSEELSQNATQGRRNDVTGTRLLEADVAEAWREGETEYATAALRFESIDVMRDRTTGAIVEGDPDRPTETTELWTFVRQPGGDWKLSAIQEA
jgi:predicted lipid-binding transport protein (Tim44 family)